MDKLEGNYKEILELYEKAQRQLESGQDNSEIILEARRALELLVQSFCVDAHIDMHGEYGQVANLQTLIDRISETNIFKSRDITVLHKARVACNRVHVDVEGPELTKLDVENALGLLDNAMKVFEGEMDEEELISARREGINPIADPEYYSSKRKHYGKWAFCHCANDLNINKDYTILKKRADDGDITAMLELASGFLAPKILWGDCQTVCMPKYSSRSMKNSGFSEKNAFDSRYYYWVCQASHKALELEKTGEQYNRRYIATALLDSVKFASLRGRMNAYVSDITVVDGITKKIYSNQSDETAEIYGEDWDKYFDESEAFAALLISICDEFGYDIIAQVHSEHSAEAIRSILACADEVPSGNIRQASTYVIPQPKLRKSLFIAAVCVIAALAIALGAMILKSKGVGATDYYTLEFYNAMDQGNVATMSPDEEINLRLARCHWHNEEICEKIHFDEGVGAFKVVNDKWATSEDLLLSEEQPGSSYFTVKATENAQLGATYYIIYVGKYADSLEFNFIKIIITQ